MREFEYLGRSEVFEIIGVEDDDTDTLDGALNDGGGSPESSSYYEPFVDYPDDEAEEVFFVTNKSA